MKESIRFCLYTDRVRLSDGSVIEKYHQIHYPHEAVSIVVFNEKEEVLLIRSKRYTVMRLEWEIPAGRMEDGESKEEAARRECLEETGCTVKNLSFLCTHNPSNGMSDGLCHVFAARIDSESMDFDENEVRTKKWVSKADVLKMLKKNGTKDGVLSWRCFMRLNFTRNDQSANFKLVQAGELQCKVIAEQFLYSSAFQCSTVNRMAQGLLY